MRRQRFGPLISRVIPNPTIPARAWRLCGLATGMAALALVVLFVCCSLSATAMEVAPPRRIGAVTRPYWETPVNGDILSLCIADLDGNAPRGTVRQSEIIVGQRKSDGTGQLSVLRADGTISVTVPVPRPVSAVAVVGDAGSERKLVIALEGGELWGVSTAVLSPIVPLSSTWTWRPQEPEAGNEILALVAADVAGDGMSDVLLVAGGRVYAMTLDGKQAKQVWKSEADIVTTLAAADGRILLGTEEGQIFEVECEKPDGLETPSCGERPWRVRACEGSSVLSLDLGNLEGDASPEVAIACKKGLDVRDAQGNRLWTYTPTLPLLQASIMPPQGASNVVLLRDQRGPFIVRRDATAGVEIIEEIHFRGLLETTSAVLADVNGDSHHEIVVGAGDSVRLFGYDADGLQPGVRWAFRGSTRFPLTSIAFGDVDGDAIPEAVMGSEKDGVVYYGAEGEDLGPVLVDAGLLKALRVVNLPEDYPSDEIIAGYADGRIYARSQSQGDLWITVPEGLQDLTVADLDGDKIPEVLAWSRDNKVHAFRANGSKYWEPIENASSAPLPLDVNGDGRQEVVIPISDTLYAYSGDRDEIWHHLLHGELIALSVTGKKDGHSDVLVASLDKPQNKTTPDYVYALRGDDGSELQSFPFGITGTISVATADLNGDEQLEVLAESADGKLHVLDLGSQATVGPREIVHFELPSRKVITWWAAADINGDGSAEIAAVSDENVLYHLTLVGQGGKESLEVAQEYDIGKHIAALQVVDLDDDGVPEIAITAADGSGLLYGLTMRQPSLLVNPRCSVTGVRTLDCSADVIDPANTRDVRLEVPHAFKLPGWMGGIIRETEVYTRTYRSPGSAQRLEWSSLQPFARLWDNGRKTQPQFVVCSKGKETLPQKLPEISVPGIRWEYKFGAAALVILVVGMVVTIAWRRERHRRAASPQGQAKQLHKCIRQDPETLLTEIGDVVAHSEDASQILTELHVLCTREDDHCATGTAEVVQGYQFLLDREQWEAGLRRLLAGLPALGGVERQGEALTCCRLLNIASTANSVARIAAMRSQIKAAQAMASVALPGLSDLKPVLPQWLKIADNLESFQKASSAEEKVSCLGYAVADLGRLNDDVRKTAREPERSMLGEIAVRWLETVSNALDDQRGRADLRASMPTQRILALDDVTVALALHNEGRAEAKNVKVALMPSEQYQILEGDGRVAGAIPARQSKSVEFHVRPLAGQGFRAEFQISYDDQRGTGRSFSFADQVSLVQVSQAYQPIPNPYYAGVGLPTGSPLFFGREDVFAFIAENIARPTLENVVLLLTGQRRCGKTSLLKQLPLKLDKRYVPVYIDGQQLGIDPGMTNLFFALSRMIAESLTATGVKVAAPTRESFEPAPSQVFEWQFLAQAKAALGERRMLLAFDEFEELEMRVRSGNLDRTIFPFLRHLMQHSENLAFIFVGTHKLEELTKDYWSIFFNIAQHKQIRFLDDATVGRLIREPVASYGMVYDDLAVERITQITAGHPYFVQLMCQSLVNFANLSQRSFITAEDLRGVLDQTFALGEAHFESYWKLASPKEQLVLAALTGLLEDQVRVTSSAISSKLAEHHYSMDPTEVSETLRGLAAQDIIDEISDGTTLLYRFKLGIIQEWIRRNRSLARAIEDTVRGPAETPTT